ncbi:protein C10-like [Saccostrea echinata]|uniref:protein C10-like n=1 Tax=Saccostrea echinata TaxID=191078 RepID=UPI002A7FCA46|nr:protein C10-like [Saccostrea echinata]
MAAPIQHFSLQDCRNALNDILDAFKEGDNFQRLEEAKVAAGNDMLRCMQIVFPVATNIQMDVIERYGFPADGEGIIRFTQAVKMYEKQDEEIQQLNHTLKTILIPTVTVIPSGPEQHNGS